ncbi:MAG: hypothetical protein WDW38_003736 [Sanguina aurantia]
MPLAAIGHKFQNLSSLCLSTSSGAQVPAAKGKATPRKTCDGDLSQLSNLSLPNLLELELQQCHTAVTRLALTAAKLPKLQTLKFNSAAAQDGKQAIIHIQLQLPSLLHISVSNLNVSSNDLASSLSAVNCPALVTIELVSVTFDCVPNSCDFQNGNFKAPFILDLAACTSLSFSRMYLTSSIQVFAPRLTQLHLGNSMAVGKQVPVISLLRSIRRQEGSHPPGFINTHDPATGSGMRNSYSPAVRNPPAGKGRQADPDCETHLDESVTGRLTFTHSEMSWWPGDTSLKILGKDPRVLAIKDEKTQKAAVVGGGGGDDSSEGEGGSQEEWDEEDSDGY